MAIDRKRLNEAERINLDRCYAESDRQMAVKRLDDRLLAHASADVPGARSWCAFRTARCSPIAMRDSLVSCRVDAVVPVKQVTGGRRVGSRGKVVHKPVIEGLVFVRLVLSDEAVAGLLRIKGIASVIGSRGRVHPVSDKEMNVFMELAEQGAFDERNGLTGVKVGSRVRIKAGPFADLEGVMQGWKRSRGLRVLAWMFGQAVTVDLTLAQIEKID